MKESSTMVRRTFVQQVFSFPVVLAAALITTLFVLAVFSGKPGDVLSDPDIWWHLNNARYLFTTHHFLRTDLFSFTAAGQPWLNIEWLSEVPYYIAYRYFAERGLFLVMMLTTAAIVIGVYLLAYMRSRDVKAAFLAAWVAALLTTVSLGPRMLLFGWLLLVVELLLLSLYRAGRDYLWALPLLFPVWINMHGSWLIGFIFLLVWVASGYISGTWGAVESIGWSDDQKRKLLAVTALSFAGLFINPYGWRLVTYPFDLAFNQSANIQYIAEWATLDFHSTRGKFILAILLLIAVLNLVRRRQWQLSELLFALIAVYAAVTYSRFTFLAGIVLAPVLAHDFRGALGHYDASRDKPAPNIVALGVLAAVIVFAMPSTSTLRTGMAESFPEHALSRLRTLPPDVHVFNHYAWGGYLLWNLPQQRVFIDPRADVFVHTGVFQDYGLAATPMNSLEIFDKYRVNYVLVPNDTSLGYLLDHTPAWARDYHDADAVLYRRSSPAH